MFLPAPVDIRRSVGVRTVTGPSVEADLQARCTTADDDSRHRGTDPDAVSSVEAHPSATGVTGVQRPLEEGAALIYAIDTFGAQSAPISNLCEFVTRRGWRLAGVHTDVDGSVHPSERPGLAAALAQLGFTAATAFVLNARTYGSTPDCLWLRVAVQCAGGVLHVVPDAPATGGEAAASGLATVVAFAQIVRPLGLGCEDEG